VNYSGPHARAPWRLGLLEGTGVGGVDSTDDEKEDGDNERTELWPPGEGSGGGRR